jgi:hypothetical protein
MGQTKPPSLGVFFRDVNLMKIDLQKQLDKALEILQNEKSTREDYNQAEDIFNAILNIDRNSPVILFYLGSLFLKKSYNALAISIFELALKFNEKLFCAWNNLGYAYKMDRQLEKAEHAFRKTVELNPKDSDGWMNLGGIFVATGTPDEAIKYSDKALNLYPKNPHAKWNRALAYLEKGDYEQGWRDYDAGVRTSDRQERNYHEEGTPKWNGDKGKTVVVYGEQGIGDEIMFASMLPDIMKDCNVILDAHPRLYEIFRESFPSLPVFGTRKDNALSWPSVYKIDARIAIGSLGKFYRNKVEDFPGTPYLKANVALIEKYKARLDKLSQKIKIGISWKGGTKQTNMEERTIKLNRWLPLLKEIDAEFISLQYTEGSEKEIDKFEKEQGIKIHHWKDAIADYDETAGLVTNLDLIVSVPQSVVHLAGALGVPTLQLTPKHALWQMGPYGLDMPWYSCVKNIWQARAGDWETVIEKAKDELCRLYQMSIPA